MSPTKLVSEYKHLAENTNFISPYSFTNMFEDFAATLEVYYMGTRYPNGFPIRTVYAEEIIKGYQGQEELYKYDMGQIASGSVAHKAKICAMAKAVLADDCGKLTK